MDEAPELDTYLPQSLANTDEQAYLDFLWSAFHTNYETGRYEFASLAFHLLYMSFVSFSIWQIKQARPDAFAMAMIGFGTEAEGDLMASESPFKFYVRLKESQIFRFLKLIGCSNQQVGEFAKFVKRRNKIAHPSGTVFFNDRAAIDSEIGEILREVRNIEAHMKPIILELYRKFLFERLDEESWAYSDPRDEINANLVHVHYMSSADLEFCRSFDVQTLDPQSGLGAINTLHNALIELYDTQSG